MKRIKALKFINILKIREKLKVLLGKLTSNPKKPIALTVVLITISLTALFYLKTRTKDEIQASPILDVKVISPDTAPEIFKIKNEEKEFVPYLIEHKNKGGKKEVSIRAKDGIQKFIFSRKSPTVEIFYKKDLEILFKKALETNLSIEYKENGFWKPLRNITENALTSKEGKDSVNILTFYRLEDKGKGGYLDNDVTLGLVNDHYIRKWTFRFRPDNEKTLYRLIWKIKTENNFPLEDIELDTNDFKGPLSSKDTDDSRTFIFYPEGISGSFEVDPTLSISTSSTTISITSNQNPSWKAVWNEAKGGLIDEFYTPSNSSLNIVNNTGSQINQGLCNLRMAVASGSNDSVAVSDQYAKLKLIESTTTRAKIRVEGDLIVAGGSTDNGDYIQDYIIYPDRIICTGLIAWDNTTSATIFEHSFNFKPDTFTNNQTATSVWLGDNDTAMTEFTSGTTWRTAANITYNAPGPVAVLQLDSSDTDIIIWTTEPTFQVAENNRFYWENSTSIDKLAWGGDNLTFVRGETFGFGSIIKIAADNTTTGSEGRKYAQDFWNSDGVEIFRGGAWDSQDEGKGRFSRLNDFTDSASFSLLGYPTFSDGFESGDTSYWSSEVDPSGNFNVNSQSKKNGNYGAQVNISSQEAYVRKDIRTYVAPFSPYRLRVRFYLNPNNITMASGDTFTILSDLTVNETPFYFIQLNYDGTNYRVRAGFQQDGTGTNGCGFLDVCTNFVNINNNSFNLIEVEWGIIDVNGYIKIWVNGAFATEITLADTGNLGIDGILFGYIAGRDAGTSGSIYLDDFKFTFGRILEGSDFNNFESSFTASASAETKVGFKINASNFNRHNPVFKINNWNKNTKSFNGITLDGKELVDGTNFNAKNIPVAKSYFAPNITWESTLDSANAVTSPSIGSPATIVNPDGSVRFGRGRYGGALSVDSFNDYISVPVTGNFDTQSGAVECWFQPNFTNTDNSFHFVCFQSFNTTYEFAVAKDDSVGLTCNSNPNCLSLYLYNLSTSTLIASVYFTTTEYTWGAAGEWQHILAVWDASLTSTDDLQLYLNGEKAPERYGAGGAYFSTTPTTLRVWTVNSFTDEIRFYDFSDGGNPFSRLTDERETTADEEYLGSESNNFTLSFTDDDSYNRGSYIFFGADEKFTGLIIDLATKGSGSNLNIDWEYYASRACNSSSDNCWISLENVQGFSDTTNNFTKDGVVSWNFAPPNWHPYSVAGSPDLYFVRAHLETGSYTTAPVEKTIVTNVALIQYFGTLTKSSHILEIPGKTKLLNLHLDEAGSTTANDNSSFRNDFSVSGATWNTSGSINSRTNRATYLTFDGTNDYLSRSTDYDFNFAQSSFSITGWFRHPTTTSGTDTIFSNATAVNGVGYKVYMNSSGNICFGIDSEAGLFPADSACSTTSYTDSTWHHFAAIKSGISSISLYIDGKLVAQDTSLTTTGHLNTDSTIFIGIDSDGSSNPWQGDLDEINIYNFDLSASEVLAEIPDPTSALFGSNPTDPLTNGLVGYWKMDESSSGATQTDRSDSSGNGTTLTDVNTTASGTGKFSKGADFESTNSEYLFAGDNTSLSITGSLTLSAWIRPESVAAGLYNIIAKWDGTNESYRLLQDGDEIRLELDSAGNFVETSASNLATSTWYHIVGVYDSTNASAKIYVNGLEAATTTTGTIPSSIGDDTGRFHIGAEDSTTSPVNFYDGIIDEVRVYNRALSSSEVHKLYEWAPGPVGWWKMDEGTGTTASDSSSLNNTLTLSSPSWVAGKFGSAWRGNGNNWASRSDDSDFDFAADDNFSIGLWFKSNSTTNPSANEYLIDKEAGTGYAIFINTSGQVVFGIDSDGTWTPADTASSTTDVYDGNWHHVEAVKQGLNRIDIYVDGVLVGSDTSLLANQTLENTDSLTVGDQDATDNGSEFNGDIDEVKIYNYARTQKQIVEDMNAGHPAPGSLVGSYSARWKFDDLSGLTAKDSSINNLNLTLSSASWTTSGKFGGALNGTGANWAFILDSLTNDILDPLANEDFSISLWVKSDSSTNPPADEYFLDKVQLGVGYRLSFTSSGQVNCLIDDTLGSPFDSATTTTDFYDANWHHIVCIRDISHNSLYLYVDGRLESQDSDLVATGSLNNGSAFTLGDTNRSDDGNEFNGDIDEVKFYRFALSPSEVLIDMNLGSSETLGSITDHNEEGFSIPNPVAYWKLDESSFGNARDSSGNLNNLTPTNTIRRVTGKQGSAANFTGNSYLSITDASQTGLDFTSSFSISFWINITGDNEDVLGKYNTSAGYFFNTGISPNTTITFGYNNGAGSQPEITSTTILNPGTWYHITGVHDDTNDVDSIYVNGVLDARASGRTFNPADSTAAFYLGGTVANGGIFEGSLDDVKIYNFALTPAQVAYEFNRGGPVGWYKMDDNVSGNGQTIHDLSTRAELGSANNGTTDDGVNNTGMNCTVEGKINLGCDLDGIDDFIDMNDVAIFDVSDTDDITISGWFYRDTSSSDDVIVAKRNSLSTATDVGYIIYIDNTNDTLIFEISDGIDEYSLTSTSTFTTPGWNHFVVTWDQDSAANSKIYINGHDDNATASGNILNIGDASNSVDFRIGSESDGGSYFDGRIDDIRIFKYSVTEPQVKKLMNDGSAVRFGPSEGSP